MTDRLISDAPRIAKAARYGGRIGGAASIWRGELRSIIIQLVREA